MPNTVNLFFEVTKAEIKRTDNEIVASGAVQTVVCNFSFCETWNGLYKFARFEGAGGVKDVRIDDDNKAVVPWEVIEAPSFRLACFGTKSSDVMLTTEKLPIKVYQSVNLIVNDALPIDKTPELVEQYENLLNETLTKADETITDIKDKADSGYFDGVIIDLEPGMFAFQILSDGHLYLFHNDNEPTPPFELDTDDGHLYYDITYTESEA